MTLSESNKFIDKTILKTREKSLDWKTLSPSYELKPIPSDDADLPFSKHSAEVLSITDSYVTSFKTGEILLLVFREPIPFLLAPPDDCFLSLRVQDGKSKYAVEIANSSTGQISQSALIRLYNLIVKDSSSVGALINDFLNS